jgi:hypothetical protein
LRSCRVHDHGETGVRHQRVHDPLAFPHRNSPLVSVFKCIIHFYISWRWAPLVKTILCSRNNLLWIYHWGVPKMRFSPISTLVFCHLQVVLYKYK